jgi:hypothetical protein
MGLVVSARKVPGSKGEEGGIAWTDLLRKGLEKGLDKFLGAHEHTSRGLPYLRMY